MHINDKKAHTVLVVDSEPDIALIHELHLDDAGYKVCMAKNSSEFYDSLKREQFSLVLLEVKMPNVNRFELLDHLNKYYPDIPVVMMMAHGCEDLAIDALKNGAVDYISKPSSLADMLKILKKVDRAISNSIERMQHLDLQRKKNAMLENSSKEIKKLKKEVATLKHRDVNSIIKSIEFDEDAYQAGVSILSYFSTVVKQKYPKTKVKIRIEQEGRTVRLIVETPSGQKDKIEKTLEEYGLVVVGEMQPEMLLQNEIDIMQLRHKLDIAGMEVSHTRELLHFTNNTQKWEIAGLRSEVDNLKLQICEAFKRESHAREILTNIIAFYAINDPAKDAIVKLSNHLDRGVIEKDKEIIIELITIIKNQNKPAFEDIKAYMISSLGGASGNLISNWLPNIFAALS